MNGRTLIKLLLGNWLAGFGLLLAVEQFTVGIKPDALPALVLVSFMLSPIGLFLFWLIHRDKGSPGRYI